MHVSIFEEHSSALPEWRRRGLRGKTLVCLDAHLDLQRISPERLSRLERCESLDAFGALEKPHHLLPDDGFSFSIEDFLYPAHRLEIIDRLIWVAPPHVKVGCSQAALRQIQQMDGVLFEEITSFEKSSGGWIEGKLLGLDITICSCQQLENVTLPKGSLIDIDIDYFVAVPGDAAWVSPRTVFELLDRLDLRPELVTLSRSVRSGFTPLRHRFFADALAAQWEGRPDDADHFERLFHLDRRLRAGEVESVMIECQREAEEHPECAATWHLLSLAERDPAQARRHRACAASLCAAYRSSLLRSACEHLSRQLPLPLSTLDILERQRSPAPELADEHVLTSAALGLIWCAGGRADRALAHYEAFEPQFGPHPQLALEIAKLLVSTQPERAVSLLQAALRDDKTRSAAHALLAQICLARGSLNAALEHLEAALARTPAWTELLPLLAAVHERLGNPRQAQELLDKHRDQRSQTEMLAQRLSDRSDLPTRRFLPGGLP